MPIPNHIKYSTTVQPFSIKKGNVVIAVQDNIQYGPTDNGVITPAIDVTATRTFWWNGITPPSAGYSIYNVFNGNSAVGGQPQIVCSTTSEDLIYQAKRFGGTNIVTSGDVLSYFASGTTDVVCVNKNYPSIITSGLTLLLDAGFTPSYPTVRNTWYDLSGNGYNANMTGGTVPFTAATASYFNYTNTPTFFVGSNNLTSSITTGITISSWVKMTDLTKRSSILDKYQTTNPPGYTLEVGTVGGVWTNTIRFYIQGSTALYGIDARGATNAVTQNVNCMITGTFDYPSRVCALYVNGASISFTNPNQTSLMGSDWSQSTNVYTVGSFRPEELIDSSMNQYNLIVYNRALSSTEVLQNYNAQKSRFGL